VDSIVEKERCSTDNTRCPLDHPIRIAPVGTAPAGTPAASAASSETFIVYWRIGVVVVYCELA
jgi:hypothetical protein